MKDNKKGVIGGRMISQKCVSYIYNGYSKACLHAEKNVVKVEKDRNTLERTQLSGFSHGDIFRVQMECLTYHGKRTLSHVTGGKNEFINIWTSGIKWLNI